MENENIHISGFIMLNNNIYETEENPEFIMIRQESSSIWLPVSDFPQFIEMLQRKLLELTNTALKQENKNKMTIDEAKEILKDYINEDELIWKLGKCLQYLTWYGSGRITIDGEFSTDELEAIVVFVRNYDKS